MTANERPAVTVSALRDLLLLDTVGATPDPQFVIACDSVGGIGPRPDDTVQVPASYSAHFSARVPLAEVLCAGAQPVALLNALCQDKTSAQPLIEEFRRMAAECGIPESAVSGSTEDNVDTLTTGIGVTVIGVRAGGQTRTAMPGDVVVCAGWPRSAPNDQLWPGHPDQITLEDLRRLLANDKVHDALPVGSKGAGWEAAQLAATAGLELRYREHQPIPLEHSGGPASCVLISCDPTAVAQLKTLVTPELPWNVIADLVGSPEPSA